ncbi:hypothetical protein DH2020_039405 [Rehmannia glutinosa]|uniref:F-box/LRR-repeat protein 15-like leucin rich repeat domain-containing protein n=1 Tax=Rehmannia glutinosa TaxID=99300 RepID=A0ABR0UVV4_REHGL
MEVEKAATEPEITEVWNKETVPKVMNIVSTKLPQRDLISLLLVSPWINRNLISHPSLWLVLDFHEMNNAGDRLVSALSLSRYQNVKHINLEFARDIEEKHLEIVKNKVCGHCIRNLEVLNLNGCQKISDTGIELITYNCPKLKVFSIYWNVRVSDLGIKNLVKNCKLVIDLNVSGYVAYKKISLLIHLQFLDLCGAQNLSDDGLSCISKCKNLVSLNLTWCVRVTDEGVIAIGESCRSLEFLSLFGIVGVTDKSLEALSSSCSNTITTLDVNGCIGIKRRSHDQLLRLFPKLRCFKVHS